LGSVSVNHAEEAELIAALEGLRRIEDGMTVHVYSDHQLVRRLLKDLVKAPPLSGLSGGERGTWPHRKHGTPLRAERWTELCGGEDVIIIRVTTLVGLPSTKRRRNVE
jgi:ribonuclease HI